MNFITIGCESLIGGWGFFYSNGSYWGILMLKGINDDSGDDNDCDVVIICWSFWLLLF